MLPKTLKLSVALTFIFAALLLANKSLAYALFFGTLTSFSPCNFILAPIILAQLNKNSSNSGAISFMVGVVIANILVGLSIVMLKNNFIDIFNSAVIKYFMATILIYLATSLLNITPGIPMLRINYKIPSNYNYNLFFGFFSALTFSPCNSASLAATINLCIDAKDITTVLIMVFYSLGTITSLIALMLCRESLNPGPWLEWINRINAAVILVFGLKIVFQTSLMPVKFQVLSVIILLILCSAQLVRNHLNTKQQH